MKKKIGLALGSGAVRGLAHVGVIKSLLKNGINIDYIAGSSIGAWVGGHYALYRNIEKLEDFTVGKRKEKLMSLLELTWRGGFIRGDKMGTLLNDWLEKSNFSDLKIPFHAIATDLVKCKQVTFSSGNLAFALRASMAVPSIFQPIKYKNKILVDGGVINPVPDDEVKKMGADIVIAVNLDNFQSNGTDLNKKIGFTNVAVRTFDIMRHALASHSIKDADIVLSPPLAKYSSWSQYFLGNNNAKIVSIGEKAMDKKIPLLKELMGE